MGQKIKTLSENDLKRIISECVNNALSEVKGEKFGQLMHFVGKNITKVVVNYANEKEEAGEVYTREDLIMVADKVFKHYNKKYPALPQDTPAKVVDNFIKKHKGSRNFLMSESKKVKRLNEAQLKKIISESIKKVLSENKNPRR